jgi:uncharacterized protein YhbP (UPF0306 family)
MNLDQIVRSILEKGHLISLATVDENGPWVSDLVYVFDDARNVYWLSAPDARHSQALLKNPNVAATITISTRSKEPNEALQIAGIAEKIEGDMLEMAAKHLAKRNYPPPNKEGEILKSGASWYKLVPNKIRVNYEPLFGREHQNYL